MKFGKKNLFLACLLALTVLLTACGGPKVDKSVYAEWLDKSTGLYVVMFEDGNLFYYIPGIILQKADSTKNEMFMESGQASYTVKDGVFNVSIKDKDSEENANKIFKEFSLNFKDGKLEATLGDDTYPMELAKFNYIESKDYKAYNGDMFDIEKVQYDLLPVVNDEVDSIKILDDETKSARSAGVIETDNLIIKAPEGYAASLGILDHFHLEKNVDGKTYTITVVEDQIPGESFEATYNSEKGDLEEVEVEQILGLETKAYHAKDDDVIKIYVNYGEKKNNDKEMLRISVESFDDDFDEVKFFNDPETQDILKSIKFK